MPYSSPSSSPVKDGDQIAAVDLGSNSFHMVVARYSQGQLRVIDRLRETVRMADGLDGRGGLSEEAHLRALCAELGLAFTERMLHWPAGPRDSDGVWAPHWYEAVWRSTGFEAPAPKAVALDARGQAVAEACRPVYERLRAHRMRP